MASDGIGGDKADAIDVGGKLIRVLRDDLNCLVAILLVNLDSIGGRDSMPLEKHHHLFDRLLCYPCALDALHAPFPNASDFNESIRVIFDDIKSFPAEVSHNAFGRHRANPFNKPAAQILLQTCQSRRFGLLSMDHLEL